MFWWNRGKVNFLREAKRLAAEERSRKAEAYAAELVAQHKLVVELDSRLRNENEMLRALRAKTPPMPADIAVQQTVVDDAAERLRSAENALREMQRFARTFFPEYFKQ